MMNTLRVAVHLPWDNGQLDSLLARHGIDVVDRLTAMRQIQRPRASGEVDVILIDRQFLDQAATEMLIERWRSNPTAIVVFGDPESPPSRESLQRGADAVVSLAAGADAVACAIWSAYYQVVRRHQLASELKTLQAKTQQRTVVDRAKSIIAERSGISESAALRKLRKEARDRRRPMHELAQVVIEAHAIMSAGRDDAHNKTHAAERSGPSR